ncbi:hypothetical protein D3C81_1173920 [compost metagenome]
MHFPRGLRFKRKPRLFVNRECVDVGAQCDDWTAIQPTNFSNNSCLEGIIRNAYSRLLQYIFNVLCSRKLFIRQLGMTMEMSTSLYNFRSNSLD